MLNLKTKDARLSRRELDCLRLAAHDKTIHETSEILNLSPRTIKSYRCKVMLKLGANTFIAALYNAMKAGIME